jgi:hypothetical protein
LIGPSGLLLVISHPLAVPDRVLWVGSWKKKKGLVTKTWMSELLLNFTMVPTTNEGAHSLTQGHKIRGDLNQGGPLLG